MAIGFTAELSHYPSGGRYATRAGIPAPAAHASPAAVAAAAPAITEEYLCPLQGPPFIPHTWNCETISGEECCQGPTGAKICCPVPCPPGQTNCRGVGCLDLQNDPNNCGRCEMKCPPGQRCFYGKCLTPGPGGCPPDYTRCGGTEAQPVCCVPGSTCSKGTCQCAGPPPTIGLACELCGTPVATCTPNGTWAFTECINQGVCEPGRWIGCVGGGTAVCGENCQWEPCICDDPSTIACGENPGQCCPADQCCNGVCCPASGSCFQGGCCVPDTAQLLLASDFNYLIGNCGYPNLGDCQSIENLSVSFQVGPEDMIAAVSPYYGGPPSPNGGFSIQLNAYNPVGPPTNIMQYIFLINDNQIGWQVEYWGQEDLTPNWYGTLLPLPSNTIPAGYLFEIDLFTDPDPTQDNVVTGGQFSVTDNQQNTTYALFQIDPEYLYPINAFQVNIIGPDGYQCSEFSSGGGTLTYSTTGGQLSLAGGLAGVCSTTPGIRSCETSNAVYEPIGPPCSGAQLSQVVRFDPALPCPYPPQPCGDNITI
jgi:hypothetical protein